MSPTLAAPGRACKAAEQFLVELIDSGLGAVLLAREAVGRDDGVVGPIAEVRFAHLLKTAQQQARGGEQDESNRDFRDDQAGAQARVSCAGGAGAAAFLQRLVDAGADGGKGGRDAADHAGDDGENEREGGDDPVETDVADEGKGLRQQVGADAQRNGRRDETDDAASDAEHQAFQKRLAEQGCCARSERESHGDFAAAANGADEQKSGEVGAGDEQDDGDGEEQGANQGTRLGDGVLMQAGDDGTDVQAGHEGRVIAHRLLRRRDRRLHEPARL